MAEFWAKEPSVLVKSFDVDPISDKTRTEKLNALTRLSLVIFVIILVFKRSTRAILLPASVMVGTAYLYFNPPAKNTKEGFSIKDVDPVTRQLYTTKKDKKNNRKKQEKKKRASKRAGKREGMEDETPNEPINPSLVGVRKLGDKKNRYGFACQQTDEQEPPRACVDGDPFGRTDDGVNISDLLSNLIEKPVPFNFRYNQMSQNSIGATTRAHNYWRNNQRKTPTSNLMTNDERMEELVNNRMRSDNLSYCNNPNFSTQNVYGVQVRGLAGYKTVDDQIE